MSTEIKRRRGTEAKHEMFTGANAEITVNTSENALHVHDGVTVGGHKISNDEKNRNTFLNPNLINNPQFTIPSPDEITRPNSIAEDYVDGVQIFSGFFAVGTVTNLTFNNGLLNFTGSIYTEISKNNLLTEYTASIARLTDGNYTTPSIDNVTVTDEGEVWRITVDGNATDIASVKFEQGTTATKHVTIESLTGDGSQNKVILEAMQTLKKNKQFPIDEGLSPVERGTHAADVIYKGQGELDVFNSPNSLGAGNSHTRGLYFTDLSPERHLRQFHETAVNTGAAKVVIMGDSLSTPYAHLDTFSDASPDCLWGYLKRKMIAQNVNMDLTFVNRGVGGKTFSNWDDDLFGTVPSNITWYTQSKPWFDYIIDEEPDVLFIAFGMNDRQNIVIPQVLALINAINLMDKIPDIVFCTTMVPSIMSNDNNISGEAAHEGRDFAAGYVRHYAKTNDLGLIDINRQYHLIAHGVDVTQTYMSRIESGSSKSIPIALPGAECSNFYLRLDIDSLDVNTLNDLNVQDGERLRIYVSPIDGPNNPNSSSFIEVGTRNGFVAYELNDNIGQGWNPNKFGTGEGGYGYKSIVTDITPGSSIVLDFTVVNGVLTLAIDNEIVHDGTITRLGQSFEPLITSKKGTITQTLDLTFDQGKYARVAHPVLTDAQIWKKSTRENIGGNDLNHPNTKALTVIYGPVIDATDLKVPSIIAGKTQFVGSKGNSIGIGSKYAVGVAATFGYIDEAFTVDNQANDIVKLGNFTNAGEQFIIKASAVYRNAIRTADGAHSYVEAWTSGNQQFSQQIDGVTVHKLIPESSIGANNCSVQLLVNDGTTTTLKNVQVGGLDSGGTGFRMLRVTN